MPVDPDPNSPSTASFISSLKDDVWHGRAGQHSFERWHFDALSDDGREALVIDFYDNYPFSRRYRNRRGQVSQNVNSGQFPAVTFLYTVDGEVEMQAVNEWTFDHFSARMDDVTCSIGDSKFRVEKSDYGSGYIVHIDVVTSRKRRIEADLEWLSIESDLMDTIKGDESPSLVWNLVAPRSDVSGRITLMGARGKPQKVVHFRGTGYHDHLQSRTSLQDAIISRCWGRAHFPNTTAVFQHIAYDGGRKDAARIALISDGRITAHDADFVLEGDRLEGRETKAEFVSGQDLKLEIRPVSPIQRSFFEARMLSQVTLTGADGNPRETEGLVETCNPKGMYNPLLRWASELKIGKNGRPPFF